MVNKKDIPEFEGLYTATEDGRIFNRFDKELKQFETPQGYMNLTLCRNGIKHQVLVHRIIAATFLPDYDCNLNINHKNGDKTNNTINNLECITHAQNMVHAGKTGLIQPKTIYSPEIITYVKDLRGEGYSYREISRKTNIPFGTIAAWLQGRRRSST